MVHPNETAPSAVRICILPFWSSCVVIVWPPALCKRNQQSTNAAPEVLAITSEGASSSCCSVQGTNCQALKAASARTQAHRGFSISGRHAVTCFHFGTIAVRSATTYANVDAACLSHSSRWLSPHGLRYFRNGDTIISNYYESPFAFSKAATLHPRCVSFCEAAH